MKVKNITSGSGNKVANQFIITEIEGQSGACDGNQVEYFQSYDSIIVKITYADNLLTELDAKYWKFSPTTSKYRAIFLGESTKETQAKIDSGEYKLVNLN